MSKKLQRLRETNAKLLQITDEQLKAEKENVPDPNQAELEEKDASTLLLS